MTNITLIIMFPGGYRKNKPSQQDYQKQVADNTAQMVNLMASLYRSNEELNKKTDLLLKTSSQIVRSNAEVCKLNEAINKQSHDAVRYIKKFGKIFMNAQGRYHEQEARERSIQAPASQRPELGPVVLSRGPSRPDLPLQYSTSFKTQTPAIQDSPMPAPPSSLFKIQSTEPNQVDNPNRSMLGKMMEEVDELHKMFRELKDQQSESIRVPFDRIEDVVMFEDDELVMGAKLNVEIASWVGEVFRAVTDVCYSKYIKGEATEKQTNLQFCQAIILNLLDFMDYMRDNKMEYWIKNRFSIINLCNDSARSILKFLKTKFPRNKKNFMSQDFVDKIEKINNSQDPRYDILKNVGVEFPPKPNENEPHYVRQIKTFFNLLITEVESQYPEYYRQMVAIFTGGNQAQVGKGGKFLIGKKFRDNVPLFTPQELDSLDFKCKSPQILRILIKWLQEMEEFVNKPQASIMEKKAFKDIKLSVKQILPASAAIKKKIADHLESQVDGLKKMDKQNKQILNDLFDNICELITIKPEGVQFLNQDDVKAIKFSQLISSCLPFLTVTRIESIIKVFRTFQKVFKDTQLAMLDLLSFRVFDLLRSKYSGSKEEILTIYDNIKKSEYMKMTRVKNRLDTPMNDLLINCKLTKSPIICQIQLLVTNEFLNEKDEKNDHFNHFLYELQRSRFGPYSEACMIISANDPRMEYAEQLRKIRMKTKRITLENIQNMILEGENKLCHLGHKMQSLHYSLPFVCCICSGFNGEYSSAFDGAECKACSIKICPGCLMNQTKNEDLRKNFYMSKLKNTKEFFEEHMIELRSIDPKRVAKLDTLLYNIMKDNDSQYALLVRFSKGIVTKKGFKRYDKIKTVTPVFFLVKNQLPNLGKCQKYDVLMLVKKVGYQYKTSKELKKYKDIEFLSLDATMDQLQFKAAELKKNFVCLTFQQNKILVIDFEKVQEDIEDLLEKNRVQSVIKQCSVTRSSVLDVSSLDLQSLSFLEKKADKLTHVRTIVADENRIEDIGVLFRCFNSLAKISLKKNKVNMPAIILDESNIVDIFFGENSFTQLPLMKSQKMTRIIFKKNKISDISNLAKSELPKLIQIGLGENMIAQLPAIKLPYLKKLIIKQNQLKTLAALKNSSLEMLEELAAGDNQISEVPVLNYALLKILELSNNKIKNIDWLKQSRIPKLEVLKLNKNQITAYTACRLEKLSVLDLSNNQINDITFLKQRELYKNLKELCLQNNQITKIFNIIMPRLITLNLTGNLISSFNPTGQNKPSPLIASLKDATSQKQIFETFFESQLPDLKWLGLVKKNKFLGRQIIAMEIFRVFVHVDYIE